MCVVVCGGVVLTLPPLSSNTPSIQSDSPSSLILLSLILLSLSSPPLSHPPLSSKECATGGHDAASPTVVLCGNAHTYTVPVRTCWQHGVGGGAVCARPPSLPQGGKGGRREKYIYKPILVLGSRGGGLLVYLKVGKERDVLESLFSVPQELANYSHSHPHRQMNIFTAVLVVT